MNEEMILNILKFVLIAALIGIAMIIVYQIRKRKVEVRERFGKGFLIGLFADFGDTLGIGSFATTTTIFKATNWLDDDRKLPGTMTVAHAIPVFMEALLFLTAVKVEALTLISMTLAAVVGAFVGTRVTANWNVRKVQRFLSVALVVAAVAMLIKLIFHPGMDASTDIHGLHGWLLVLGISVNFCLGIFMTMGLGNYTPELIFFSLVGMNPLVAFPIMMMDAAMIFMTSAVAFIRSGRVEWRGVPGIIIGGVIGVLLAVQVVNYIDITMLSYLIVGLSVYTASTLWRDSKKPLPEATDEKTSLH
ncbi:TSUP family transporter [Weissella ceti]|uniref:Probable membrane transporter protein n=1 Tax=Weissella ceti TaxID=759620 RepID=A0ABT3E3D4_9LACO|nr:TSUP family transporter [Weissella ceti]MCW0952764.1 TSUP family transporter [Weissella ceti]QVK12462.1 TSUP family transporter [Weissella ceti]